jgi:hypothetical protein
MESDRSATARKIVAFGLTPGEAERRIKLAAVKTENVLFGDHASERMEERGITDAQIYEVLRRGHVVDPPEKTQFGEWKCKMTKQLRGGRETGVVTIILKNGKLFLKTVEWEDPQ